MICVVCRHSHARVPQVCEGCREHLGVLLGSIAAMHARLPGAMARSAGRQEAVSGSREPPVPVNLDALDLSLSGRTGAVYDVYRDQTGLPSVAAVLDSWCRDWRETRGLGALSDPRVPQLCRWLGVHLPWACDEHPALDEFAGELRQLRGALAAALGELAPAAQDIDAIPCARCDQDTLKRKADYVECASCGLCSTEDEHQRWLRLLLAQLRATPDEQLPDLGVLLGATLAAEAAQVSPAAIRQWVHRGRLYAAGRAKHGWPLYRLGDVLAAQRATRRRCPA